MSTEDTSDVPDNYCLNSRDQSVIANAIQLVEKILRADFITAAEIVSVAKVLHVLKRLPQRSTELTVTISLSGPTRQFGEHRIYHFWQVNVFDSEVEISSGGHFYRKSTGGDTFTCMHWSAQPGFEADYGDYLEQHKIVDDAQPFDQEIATMDLSQAGYTLSVTDDDNPLLEEIGESDQEKQSGEVESPEVKYTEAEQQLVKLADLAEGRRRGDYYSNPPERCDACGCEIAQRAFFVDARLRGQIMFASLCAECFLAKGEGIGWGQGQLYQREPDCQWLLVAGFPPKEKQ